ncbi:transposase [Bradyrhizobium sp. 150]|uniref:IS66 family transposase n=1 Tax=Bradyrhizobium sp. 150 TaxID=2782625 RepID=UPI0031F5F5C2
MRGRQIIWPIIRSCWAESCLAFVVGPVRQPPNGSGMLKPLHTLQRDTVMSNPGLFPDETPLPVLDPGRGRAKVCQFWLSPPITVRGAAWRRRR